MRSQFIRSSCRVKPDPTYYRRLADRLRRQRDALLDAMGRNDDVQPADDPPGAAHRLQLITDKLHWANRMIPVATRLLDDAARSRAA